MNNDLVNLLIDAGIIQSPSRFDRGGAIDVTRTSPFPIRFDDGGGGDAGGGDAGGGDAGGGFGGGFGAADGVGSSGFDGTGNFGSTDTGGGLSAADAIAAGASTMSATDAADSTDSTTNDSSAAATINDALSSATSQSGSASKGLSVGTVVGLIASIAAQNAPGVAAYGAKAFGELSGSNLASNALSIAKGASEVVDGNPMGAISIAQGMQGLANSGALSMGGSSATGGTSMAGGDTAGGMGGDAVTTGGDAVTTGGDSAAGGNNMLALLGLLGGAGAGTKTAATTREEDAVPAEPVVPFDWNKALQTDPFAPPKMAEGGSVDELLDMLQYRG